ncbi:hypothetical protein GGR34_003572 [Microvirga flocculans]|uniref:DUF6194 domain-containing protein n=1 Tax=Microvirga flocculans TaxID=217168 RepID=A0A7W6IIB8_9HYPH|nr:DUF6194 family protein [Microvirga flocculans]MBB4041889.1 hypothetical protein [Microvirga flocculans]
MIRIDDIRAYILDTLPGIVEQKAWGETAFFHNPERQLPNGVYFLTVKHRDSINDHASQLSIDGSFRVNIGLPKKEYARLFGPTPPRPAKGRCVDTGHDFSLRDRLMPHPVYAWMGWVAVAGLTVPTFDSLKPQIVLAHEHAKMRFSKRISKEARTAR